MEREELKTIVDGLEKTLDCLTDYRRIKVIKPMYIEVLVALKLLEEGHKVEPFQRVFDIFVDDKHRIEVKSGEMGRYSASASFGKGSQIRQNKFDYCVFVVLEMRKAKTMCKLCGKEVQPSTVRGGGRRKHLRKAHGIKATLSNYAQYFRYPKQAGKIKEMFVFTREELKECVTPRPKMTEPETPCILFWFEDFEDFLKYAVDTGEPIFEIERELHEHPENFKNRWEKICTRSKGV